MNDDTDGGRLLGTPLDRVNMRAFDDLFKLWTLQPGAGDGRLGMIILCLAMRNPEWAQAWMLTAYRTVPNFESSVKAIEPLLLASLPVGEQ